MVIVDPFFAECTGNFLHERKTENTRPAILKTVRPFAVLLALVNCCCHSSSDRIRVAIFRGEELTPLAEALGHFRQEGLDVEIVAVPSSSKAMEALFGGSVEAVTGGYDQAIRLAAEGRRARSFAVLTVRSPLALVASPKSPKIQRVEDLKGSTIGVSAFGSSGHNLVNLLLARHGLAPADVNVVATGGGHSVTVAAAEQGRLDAVVTLPASLAILKARHPRLVVLADGTSPEGTEQIFGVREYPAVCLMARTEWLEGNREPPRRLAKAMIRTLEWARTHSAEDFRAKLDRASGPPEELEGFRATIASCAQDGRMPAGGPEAVRETVAFSSPAARKVDLPATFTDDFVSLNTPNAKDSRRR